PPPVTRMTSSIPEATASSTPYWMVGLSTSGSISFGCALVTGRKRVPNPAAGKTALRTGGTPTSQNVSGGRVREGAGRPAGEAGTRRRRLAPHEPRGRPRHLRHARDGRADGAVQPQVHRAAAARGLHHRRLR